MLSTGHDEGAHVGRIRDISFAQGIGKAQRLSAFPDLERGSDVEDLGASPGCRAAVENTLRAIGQRIGLLRISEWEIVGGIEVVYLFAPCMAGLSESHIERDKPAADVRIGSLKGDA